MNIQLHPQTVGCVYSPTPSFLLTVCVCVFGDGGGMGDCGWGVNIKSLLKLRHWREIKSHAIPLIRLLIHTIIPQSQLNHVSKRGTCCQLWRLPLYSYTSTMTPLKHQNIERPENLVHDSRFSVFLKIPITNARVTHTHTHEHNLNALKTNNFAYFFSFSCSHQIVIWS